MRIAVIGAGLMGRAAVYDLARAEGVEEVGLYDIDISLAESVANKYGNGRTICGKLDAGDLKTAEETLRDFDAALSCVTYRYNPGLTRAAISGGCSFVDLGGNNDAVREQLSLDSDAEKAGVSIIPDCGLAPGFVAILVADGISRFDKVSSIRIRVGGLPQRPKPPLNYQMVFSAEGLINEYWEPCVIVEDGRSKTVDPMSGLESLHFGEIGDLEAFYTSGGTSTLPDTLAGKIDFLDYKTIRYPGHRDLFLPMLQTGLASRDKLTVDGNEVEPRSLFKAVLDKNLSFGEPDLVLVRVTVEGESTQGLSKCVYEIVDRQDEKTGLTAMMRTTAFPAAIVTWMAASGKVKERGVKPQELVIDPNLFLPELAKREINLTISEE